MGERVDDGPWDQFTPRKISNGAYADVKDHPAEVGGIDYNAERGVSCTANVRAARAERRAVLR
eukprot:scaffold9180_cov35-Tisochrysis_lutea.AAC.5